MSFRDPLGPAWPAFGRDIVDKRSACPDVSFETIKSQPRTWQAVTRSVLKGGGVVMLATTVLTSLVFLPVLYGELSSVETVGLRGDVLTVSEFVFRLKGMLFGSFIVAFSLVCFLCSSLFVSLQHGGHVVEQREQADAYGVKDPLLSALIGSRHV